MKLNKLCLALAIGFSLVLTGCTSTEPTVTVAMSFEVEKSPFEPNTLILLDETTGYLTLAGSSTCPPSIANVSFIDSKLSVVLNTEDHANKSCTEDLIPHLYDVKLLENKFLAKETKATLYSHGEIIELDVLTQAEAFSSTIGNQAATISKCIASTNRSPNGKIEDSCDSNSYHVSDSDLSNNDKQDKEF